ncbi:MAG TPA: PEGA domain-containing protein [Kofleriaceae bacterium]|nr:PEGA domain-containing protein [Kofleriaceae bacterium]
MGGGIAHAGSGDRTVAILEIALSGDAAPELRNQIVASVADGLRDGGIDVISRDKVRAALDEAPDLAGCTSTTCLSRLGEMVGTERFVRGDVRATGAAYTVTLELLDASGEPSVIGQVTDACTVCTMTDLSRRIRGAAEKLASGGGSSAPVEITSQPTGATLTIDGQPAGATPYFGDLSAGEHAIGATLPGYRAATESLAIRAGETEPQKLALELSREPSAQKDAFDYGTWKWVTGAGAVAAMATGIILVKMDGDGTCDLSGPQRQCEDLRSTMAPGIVSIGAGLGLGVLSGWMFYRDREQTATVAVGPEAGGASAQVTVRF